MKLHVFINLVDLPGGQYIAEDLLDKIVKSDLINNCTLSVFCNYHMANFEWAKSKLQSYPNVEYIDLQAVPAEYEMPALVELKKFCDCSDDTYVLWLHHKGVTRLDNPNVDDWRNMMAYFTIEQWRDCIAKLDEGYDTAGTNWRNDSVTPWHYSGAFFWANAKYIKTLPPIVRPRDHNFQPQFNFAPYPYQYDAEFWMGIGKPNAYCAHESNINHYNVAYPATNYRK